MRRKVVDETNWMEADAKTYVAMLEDLDSEVGRLLKALEESNLVKNTLVIFVSDNGGFAKAAHMGPLRGAKSSTLEGGIRVPLIVRWPGRIASGKTSDQVCATFDLTRSILNLAGAKTLANLLDGFDVVDHVAKQKPNFKRTLYWRGKRGERTWWAVRDGNYKYVRKTEGTTEEWLYDLSNDIGESNDLSQKKSEQVARLRKLLAVWEEKVQPVR